jgi:hypothetical protein
MTGTNPSPGAVVTVATVRRLQVARNLFSARGDRAPGAGSCVVSVQALAQHVDSLIAAHDVACWRVLHAARVLRDECGDVFEMFILHVSLGNFLRSRMDEIGHI